ncbi:MAG TPA: AMP-binding protein [Kiritimatiellia bacterium]|nr:AMP-binding protein [Kiritimatiellia bacterium]HOM59007.1 AMP-binding protein [Kiritimatiellia bacterium]HOR98313.1 AMP-binding protein [Kiritimatiellia bacterium]HPC48979.1 AMP-binding protein [Kiritimatiellia bacterium]HPK37419.1 AMP-binding protein [Kiritimatiellia bacterium]
MREAWLNQTTFNSYEAFYREFHLNVPECFNFAFDVVDAIAAEDPERRAMVWCDDQGSERVFTMSDIARASNQAARAFATAGIRRGDAVMLILKRRYEYWFALMGLCRLGAVAIPATNQLTQKDVVYRIRSAGVSMILCVNEPAIRAAVDAAVTEAPVRVRALVNGGDDGTGWMDFNAACDQASPEPLEAALCARDTGACDPMLLYFTSGTTGMPKMVQHDFLYPFGHVVTARYWQGCTPGGLHLTLAETGWAKAAWGKIYGQWMCGCAVMVYDMDRFHAEAVLRIVERYRVTTFCAPPTIYRYLIKEDLKRCDLSALTRCVVAGEPLNPEVYQQFLDATGLKLYEGYGQTEVTVAAGTFPWMKPKPGSMGCAAPGYDLDLIRHDGRPCEVGEEGQLVIRTERSKPLGMFNGYYRDPELTHQMWRDGVYYTGDMAWRDEDGYFWFVGRADDVIKSSGYRIGPFEVESALLEHPAVLECAVTGVPDPDRGQVVKATVVLAKGFEASDALASALQEHVKRITAPYKYPRRVEFVSELPKTISGKIRRVQIREQDQRNAE